MNRAKHTLIAATAGILALSACTPTDVQTDNPRQRTTEGAAIGAAAGAVAGILTGDDAKERRRGAVIGAVIGGAAGGLVGNNLDKQAAELNSNLSSNIDVVNTGSELVVTMPQDILFDIDSSALRSDLRADLRVLAQSLSDYPDTTVDIIGHTDNTGEASYNQALSARRAESVSRVLTNQGVSTGRLRAYGRGEDAPIASNLTDDGRAQNRRVEIIIRPTT